MFRHRSKLVFVFALVSVSYSVIQAVLWSRSQAALTELFETQPVLAGLGTVASGVASIVLLPHFFSSVAASILAVIGFLAKNDGLVLASAVLLTVATALFFVAALWLVPVLVVGFWGYSIQRRINHKATA